VDSGAALRQDAPRFLGGHPEFFELEDASTPVRAPEYRSCSA
jgi:hypothetical protein